MAICKWSTPFSLVLIYFLSVCRQSFIYITFPLKHFLDKVIVMYKGRVIFRQYIPKKHKRFGIKIYKLCDSLGYTYDMSVYLGKQRQHATTQITATHGRVLQVIRRVEGLGHKIFVDNYFTSPAVFDDLFQRKSNVCGTVRHDRRGMPRDIGPKFLKMRRVDTVTRVRETLRAVRWKDRRTCTFWQTCTLPLLKEISPTNLARLSNLVL